MRNEPNVKPAVVAIALLIGVYYCDSLSVIHHSLDNQQLTIDWPSDDWSSRSKRSPNDEPNAKPNVSSPSTPSADRLSAIVSSTALNDSHEQLTVHWSAKGSPVIICLAKNRPTNSNQSSAIYISYDYGKNFLKITSLVLNNNTDATLNSFFISPAINSHYIFVDSNHSAIFVTRDFGKTFRRVDLPFRPQSISLHPTNVDLVLATSAADLESRLWLSMDFGINWRQIQDRVKQFSWGVPDVDNSTNTVFIQRREPNGFTTILSSTDFFANESNTTNWLNNVNEFQIAGDYMFATRKLKLIGFRQPNRQESYQLWVSYKRRHFSRSLFPLNKSPPIDFYIADASQEAVLACVTHNDSTTHLYVSGANGTDFSLSLENIIYLAPNVTKHPFSFEWRSEDPLCDIQKVAGIRGIYIASKWREPKKSVADMITVISYDMGSKWQRLRPPYYDADGIPIDCNSKNNCSLHLSQKFSSLYPYLRLPPILSRSSSVGLIMASGVVGQSIKGKPNVYLSIDAGITWRQVLNGNYIFAFGDFGAIIVAISYFSKNGATNELKYSIDEGLTWSTLKFIKEKIRIYGLMTEPGEKTTIFTLFGSREEGKHEWILLQIDFSKVFASQCVMPDDYDEWSPHDSDFGCLLGRRQVFQRRKANHKCFNGQQYVRPVTTTNCSCRNSDFECDIGFVRDANGAKCVLDDRLANAGLDLNAVPDWCKVGKFFNRTRGYRKISGDTCIGGDEEWYLPMTGIPCPFNSHRDEPFILFVQRQAISRLALNVDKPVKEVLVPSSYLINVIAADFDYEKNCVYWSDIGIDKIMRLCLNGIQSQPEILVETGLLSVEGIAFNSINNHLYFVDGDQAKVELIRTDIDHDGRMRRTILSAPHLEKPRGIAINAIAGYIFLTDWSVKHAAIIRCELDGSNVKVLFNSSTVSWPNGITVDYASSRIFWADAKRDYIASSDYDGKQFKYLVQGELAPHPFALMAFKNFIYYDDWNLQKIIMINKNDPSVHRVVLSDIFGGMDLKVITSSLQNGTNGCSENRSCSHLCVAKPFNGYRCVCPDGFVVERTAHDNERCLCKSGEELTIHGECRPSKMGGTCSGDEFACANGNLCIQNKWKCDGDDDCGDGSDELDCANFKCNDTEFRCRKGSIKCIPSHYKCDFENDLSYIQIGKTFQVCSHTPFQPQYEMSCNESECVNTLETSFRFEYNSNLNCF